MKFREVRHQIRGASYRARYIREHYKNRSQVILDKQRKEESTRYQVYIKVYRENWEIVHDPTKGNGIIYPFSIYKEGFFWKYRSGNERLGESDETQSRLFRKNAERLAYEDAMRFGKLLARKLDTTLIIDLIQI